MPGTPSPTRAWFTFWRETLADLLFPPSCLSCGGADSWWCERCQAQADPLPLGCGDRLRLSSLTSCFAYADSIERLIRGVKFRPAAIGLSRLAERPVVEARLRVTSDTWLIPLPSARVHEAKRGFNQATMIAQQIAERSGARVIDGLVRTRDGQPQVGLSAAERWKNAEGLYRWSGPPLSGQRCVLVDDVVTTGASLAAASQALRAAGAHSVRAVTLAQTPPHPQGATCTRMIS